MKRMSIFSHITISMLLSFSIAAKPTPRSDSPLIHLDGKVKGIILNLVCEPITNTQITFTNKKTTQLITPDRNGHFIVDLPGGEYLVSISMLNLSGNQTHALILQRGKNGEIRLLVNTGLISTCSCFEPDLEDMLIPVEPIVINPYVQERRPIVKP